MHYRKLQHVEEINIDQFVEILIKQNSINKNQGKFVVNGTLGLKNRGRLKCF